MTTNHLEDEIRATLRTGLGHPSVDPGLAEAVRHRVQRRRRQTRALAAMAVVAVGVSLPVVLRTDGAERDSRPALADTTSAFAALDWANTTVDPPAECAAGGGAPQVTLRHGGGLVSGATSEGPGAGMLLVFGGSSAGRFVAGSTAEHAAVLLYCRHLDPGGPAVDTSFVQIYRDDRTLLATLTPPAVDGQVPTGFADRKVRVTGNELFTAVDYPPAQDTPGLITRRTFVWRWNGTEFTPFLTGEESIQVVPKAFIDVWAGDIARSDLAAPQRVALEIAGGEQGTVIGTLLHLHCSGKMKLLSAAADGSEIYLEELPGNNGCAPPPVRLTIDASGRLHYDYVPPTDSSSNVQNLTGGGIFTNP
ncbi:MULTISPECIES: hypothetical protein [unclassified Pseudofrankia]|uniref:hypothetical protein n=1 Tax=unclassified Pseudofrankia TaxID=2994372 RepID=UPI0008DA9965|nr:MULTISPECIES: hypothetical protein [unclassified Pseudofrankia]MDT3445447.1 hypothetical protein [Pseudofrankia sp. BMG5.37]OHV67514.1 hypothetical protein BCD48_35335 [Pseudofrankia sp. BMG5.36]